MSKSKGNVIYPEDLVEKYGLDSVRYFLLREMPTSQDAIFSPESFIERYNFDLCNDLSNLLNRTVSMVNKYFEGNVKELEEFTIKQIDLFDEKWNKYEIANSIQEIWTLISRTNKYIDETMPWALAKEEEKEKLSSVMYHLIENLRKIAILIKPFMNDTADNILRQIGITDKKLINFENLKPYDKLQNIKVIEKGEPIFMRLNAEEEIEYIKNLMKK